MATIGQVLSWEPSVIGDAADALVSRRRSLVELQDEMDAGAPPSSWASGAATKARGTHRRLWLRLADLIAEVSQVATALDIAQVALGRAKTELQETLTYAAGNGFSVDTSSGRVSDSMCVVEKAAADRRAICDEIVDRIEQGLRNAGHADTELAETLRRAAMENVDGGTSSFGDASTRGADGGGRDLLAPPEGGSAHDQSAWWEGLTPDEQQQVIAEHPEWIGNTDGIPAWARDRANRDLIGDYRGELESEQKSLEKLGLGPPVNQYFLGKLGTVEDKVKGLDAVEHTLGLGNRQLLLLDVTGEDQLKAAIAYGDIDTADHVAVFTPGFASTVAGSLGGSDREMREIAERAAAQADKYGDGGTVATVTWLGYEAPQWDTTLDPNRSVAGEGAAQVGAKDLASFYNGIDASRDTDPHLTALGYSYGSLTTGLALQNQTGVDDAVIFGSSGIGTSHLSDLDIPDDHFYRIEARRDVVADLGQFGIDPSHLDGVRGLSAEAEEIGGTRYAESLGHSEYLRNDTTSQHNIASIVGGSPDQIVEDGGKGIGDILSWPLPWTY